MEQASAVLQTRCAHRAVGDALGGLEALFRLVEEVDHLLGGLGHGEHVVVQNAAHFPLDLVEFSIELIHRSLGPRLQVLQPIRSPVARLKDLLPDLLSFGLEPAIGGLARVDLRRAWGGKAKGATVWVDVGRGGGAN